MASSYSSLQNPYGLKPLGNMFCEPADVISKRSKSIGSLGRIPEDILLSILGFLTVCDVCTLSLVSKVLYVYCHHSELWRDATLNRWPGDFYYRTCWKDTYVLKLLSERGDTGSFVPHRPLRVSYMFSDLLHRFWACRSYDVRSTCKGFYTRDTVQRRQAAQLSVRQFVEEFERPNVPLLIEGGCKAWRALSWDFVSRGGAIGGADKKPPRQRKTAPQWFKTTSTTGTNLRAADILFTFDQYLSYAAQAFEEAPLYLFDSNFVDHHRAQEEEKGEDDHPCIGAKDFEVPKYFRRGTAEEEQLREGGGAPGGIPHYTDLFHVLQEEAADGRVLRRRPDYRWLIAGPAFSGSFFHKDPNMTHAWNAVVKGRKKWVYYPPSEQPPGVFATEDGAEVAVPVSLGEWLLSFWGEHLTQRDAAGALECVAEAGDVVFVPHGWWHMVVNLDELSVAVTQNYLADSNLPDALRFFRETPDQISGLGLRRLEAVHSEGAGEPGACPAADSALESGDLCYEPEQLGAVLAAKLCAAHPGLDVAGAVQVSLGAGTLSTAPPQQTGAGPLGKKRRRPPGAVPTDERRGGTQPAPVRSSEQPSVNDSFQFSFF
jgi:hypothetical protein